MQPCALLLATLSANHEVHAWFAGSGAIQAVIACHHHCCTPARRTLDLEPARQDPEAGGRGIEALLMSCVANLSFQPASAAM
eukprot:COSAG01_NODE_57112_length_314_cov_0.944186_1_plen_81_part_01